MLSPDYEDLFSTLNAFKIKYLVIGAHAVIFYTEPRFTKDMDVWIPAPLNDSQRVYDALKAYGAPLAGVTPKDFQDPGMMLQIGVAPVRVDILVGLSHVSVQEAWKHRVRSRYGKAVINMIGKAELIQAKKAAGRPQDRLDVARLERPATTQKKRS